MPTKLLSLEEFTAKYNGKYLEFNNDQYKNQCMDLFWAYLKEVLGIDPTPYRGWGTAKNCYNSFYKIKNAVNHFNRIPNTPNGVPKKGDIVFWGTYPSVTGFAGHVAIYVEGNVWIFVSFDQNYPTGAPCIFYKHGSNKVFHGYRGVMGWWSPKNVSP